MISTPIVFRLLVLCISYRFEPLPSHVYIIIYGHSCGCFAPPALARTLDQRRWPDQHGNNELPCYQCKSAFSLHTPFFTRSLPLRKAFEALANQEGIRTFLSPPKPPKDIEFWREKVKYTHRRRANWLNHLSSVALRFIRQGVMWHFRPHDLGSWAMTQKENRRF